MNRSADQALRSLLPTHNGPFPPQLADLASSLLAQSRHRASTLKADEEIARSYACAHIACDRLKTSLNLPPIEPRPPIQPRLYKRLYAYMNTVLKPASSAAINRAEGSLASPANRATPSKTSAANTNTNTPSKISTPSRTPLRMPVARAFMNLPPPPKPAAGTFPPWLRPTVRFVCHELGCPILAPTILAGLTVIHREVEDEAKSRRPKGARPQEEEGNEDDDDDEDMTEWLEANLTSLVAALYLYSVTSWRGVLRERQAQKEGGAGASSQDASLEERQFQLDEKAILGVFDRVRSVVGKGSGGNNNNSKPIGDEAWFGWQDLQRRTFRDALVVVSEQQWLQSDWYQDINTLGSSGGIAGNDDDLDGDGQGSGSDGEGDGDDVHVNIPTKVWRADSMYQARYDFLSESKQQEYDSWRAGLLETIASAPASTLQPMEVDS